MQSIRSLSFGATATIFLAMLLQGCASTPEGGSRQRAAMKCSGGEIVICGTSSSGRISDGRYGHNRGSRRNNCSCQPEHDLDAITPADLPSEPH